MKLINIVGPTGNGPRTGLRTLITTGDGVEVQGVVSVDLALSMDSVTKATLELMVADVSVEGVVPVFVMRHPLTGERKLIDRIEFSDGSHFQA